YNSVVETQGFPLRRTYRGRTKRMAATNTTTEALIREIEENQEWAAKWDRQVELEEKMRTMGVDRHWSKIARARENGQETTTRSVRRLLHHSIEQIAEGIRAFLADCESGKAGR